MTDLTKAFEQLKIDEGFEGDVYLCSAGKRTIGYGRNVQDNPLTIEEAEYLLRSDIKRVRIEAEDFLFFGMLSDARQGVIINMLFQLGLTGFRGFVNFIQALNDGDHRMAAHEMIDSKWYRDLERKGSERAKRLVTIMIGYS